ncbi:MAG: hypothetical protein PF541_00255 [Prolixibacteraceae bacterium]|jgi:hypothetical protein|nr:hypothetical protein [Prolixibacteraceae bacterium]
MNRIIINFVLVAIVLAFVACEQTIFVGGTATDFQSGDSIEGLEMGLTAAKA